ncbi:hypothetical protein Lalb_Chr08g0237871 [Lupinus albus]|uniref:Uncharacterized protein n=1 Tax=Lupinus albus TaxID=3870 RepID=A0A6A4Q5B7_LUPAL|nr:hypothetical protein Lalb_Chr08g0237871 [Lupinus albus]
MVKCRGRKQKGQQLSADTNATVSNSSNQIGSEAQNCDLNYKGKCRGRKPKAGSELRDNSNHVVSQAHKHEHADRRVSKRVKKNVVPSAKGQKIGEGAKMESDDDDLHIGRLVHCPVLNVRFLCEDNDEANARKRTKYREKLIEELKKPYCQEEYERLFKDITVRKLAQGQRVLRRHTKSYNEDHVSKSYLDCHIDLKRKINRASDDYPKVLNLMRGFFYWLVNISHEGVFRPWRVQPYLDMLLQQ